MTTIATATMNICSTSFTACSQPYSNIVPKTARLDNQRNEYNSRKPISDASDLLRQTLQLAGQRGRLLMLYGSLLGHLSELGAVTNGRNLHNAVSSTTVVP